MIQTDSITVNIGDKTILKEVSFSVDKGQKAVLYGESGTGKSTLLKTLIGMHVPTAGTVTLAGFAMVPENLGHIRKQLFYLPQDILPQGDETVLEYLKTPFQLGVNRQLAFPEPRMMELLTRMRLKAELLTQPLYQLSGGERKRVGLLSGLLLGRSIILADEPTAGVDAANREVIVEMLFTQNDATVLAVTHDEEMISRASHKIELHLPASGKTGGLAGRVSKETSDGGT